ncbi:MAG TPA: hypothetical protein VEL79_02745 [Vicinamibacterales bacterium]|nr:hypothetical protein [Vicinamibacterales bacterium]
MLKVRLLALLFSVSASATSLRSRPARLIRPTSPRQAAGGGWHMLEVRLKRGMKANVHARAGY